MGETVKRYIKLSRQKPGNVYLGVVHRLDRPVSGAVIFARTSKALSRMNEMLQKREIRKVYWAVSPLPGPPPRPHPVSLPQLGEGRGGGRGGCQGESWILLTHYLKKNEQQNKSYVYDGQGQGRLKAELKYREIARSDRYVMLEVELLTGRHHQIRAQLSAIGYTIKGDLKYGAPRSNPDGSIHLHSRLLEFVHPVSGSFIRVVAPVPDEKIWMIFEKLINYRT
jgi:23S rRNA pseudouridine1911/1915/1917 synthase